jgi:hypothetical protein
MYTKSKSQLGHIHYAVQTGLQKKEKKRKKKKKKERKVIASHRIMILMTKL